MLRARTRTERDSAEIIAETDPAPSPEEEALLADSVGLALLVVLDTLEPAERLAFVPHDMFAVPFDESLWSWDGPRSPLGNWPVEPVVGCSRTRPSPTKPPPPTRGVAAFLAAARHGDFAGLVRLLDPDVVVRADAVAVEMATARASSGAPALSREMYGVTRSRESRRWSQGGQAMMVDGLAGSGGVGRWPDHGDLRFHTARSAASFGIELISDPEVLSEFRLEPVQR